MDRLDRLRQGIVPDHDVLEIGPYHNPIAPKKRGYRTVSIDICSGPQLREMAAKDPNLGPGSVDRIEDVDLVGSACDLAELSARTFGPDRRFDWILSSHNIEHIPNPVRFLRQCAAVLRPGGVLRLAVPDKRACFDHFRSLTEVSEWLQAYREDRVQPTIEQLFREESYQSRLVIGDSTIIAWGLGDDRHGAVVPLRQSLDSYRRWFGPDGGPPAGYVDTHCWAFTPQSFELLVRDTIAFGLTPFEVASVSATAGHEFFVDLRATAGFSAVDEEAYYRKRTELLRQCVAGDGNGASGPAIRTGRRRLHHRVWREVSRVGRQLHILPKAY
jgi:SAM-dependent methyltransferase